MSSSHTTSSTDSFTIAHARKLSSKVITDMERCSQIYRSPSSSDLAYFKEELTQFLHKGYISKYQFGFERDGKMIVCWRYTVQYGDLVGGDDCPGKVHRRADTVGASYFNMLTYSAKWTLATAADKLAFERDCPVERGPGTLPSDGNGFWTSDKNYAAGSGQASRQTFVSY